MKIKLCWAPIKKVLFTVVELPLLGVWHCSRIVTLVSGRFLMMSKVCQAKELTHISLSSNIVGPANHEWQSTDNYEWCSGDGYIGTHIKMCRCTGCFVGGKNSQNEIRYSLISHQTGAMFSTLLDQMIEFMAILKLITAIQTAKEHAPIFQDWNIFLDIDKIIKKHDPKFAIATRGKVESMLGRLGLW